MGVGGERMGFMHKIYLTSVGLINFFVDTLPLTYYVSCFGFTKLLRAVGIKVTRMTLDSKIFRVSSHIDAHGKLTLVTPYTSYPWWWDKLLSRKKLLPVPQIIMR